MPPLLRSRGIGPERDVALIAENRKNYDAIWPGSAKIAKEFALIVLHLQSNNVLLGLATTNRRSIIERFLALLPFANPFQVIVTGEDVKKHKPDPEVYELAATKLNLPTQTLRSIEDTAIGIESSHGAGIRCAVVPNSFNHTQDFSKADICLESLHELFAIKGDQ
jgi:HAD superfamily hydrolase (TIGR01509 family)